MANVDAKMLDTVVKQTISAVEKGKTQIYDIYEAANKELNKIKQQYEALKQRTAETIARVDALEKKERQSRLRLMEVSRNFQVYKEADIKQAYEETSALKVELAVAREQEQNLRRERDAMELTLRSMQQTVNKAENLVAQVGAALGYLNNQMETVVDQIETVQQRQAFGTQIIKAQEEERRRVAREIHDGPAQAMANIVFRTEVCERLIDVDLSRAKGEMRDLQEQVRGCLQETRKIIFALRPMTLDDLGLAPTVRRLLDTLKERKGFITELQISGEEKRYATPLEIGLFRIIQEALNNAEKHSQARCIWVRIDFRPDLVVVIIEDDGVGFDTGAERSRESFGLMGMRERVELLNGEVVVRSEKRKGTKVMVKVPL
ncbi:MAG: degS [Firmicutes bacterium]|nr:degS [Bacillota bacterium]